MGLADEILSIVDLQRKKVHVPVWDRDVWVQELDLAHGLEILDRAAADGKVMFTAEEICTIVTYGVVDEEGNPIFSAEHVAQLQKKSRAAVTFLYEQIMSLSGTIGRAGKNSKASQA